MKRALDIADLRAFTATVRAGSLTRAAMSLGITQPAVSQRLQRLERALGCRLLDRASGGVRLTSSGDGLLGYAERLVALHDEAQAALRPGDDRSTGPVTIALLEDIAPVTLPGVLVDFAAVHPQVELEVLLDSAQALAERSAAGGLDMTVGDASIMDAAAVRWRTTAPLVWTAVHGFDVTQEPLPLVLFSLPCRWRRPILDALARHGRRWRVAFQSTSLVAVQAAVSAGLGVAALLPINVPAGSVQLDVPTLPTPPAVDIVIARRAGLEHHPPLDTLERMLRRAIEQNTPATTAHGR
jgi:DNA-binding transcriptional LysR family regulator